MTDPSGTTCPRCGSGVNPASKFCANCGASLSGESSPSVSAAVAPQGRLSDSGALEMKTLLVAATHGDYEILEELGRGGMAVVYRALEVHLKRPVAIKVLPPDLTYAKGATERFQREAQTAAALDHPNIIPIYRISSGGKLCWYAMKYLEGRSLADVISEKGLLTVNETIQILEQVGSALDYAHQRGVVHRDVKPGNVMLDVNGRVTVTDFGIAKELTSGALTGSGAILGTPYYMSPEQCRGSKEMTGAADQYSLGVMAYQMISGQLPFDADSAIDVIHKHVSEPPPQLETLLPGLPKHVISAVNIALSKKPQERYPTVAAFVGALKHGEDMQTLRLRRSAIAHLGLRSTPLGKRTIAAAAAAVVIIGVSVAMLAKRTGAAQPPTNSLGANSPPVTGNPAPAADAKAPATPAKSQPRSRPPRASGSHSTARQPAAQRTASAPPPSQPAATPAPAAGGRKLPVTIRITNTFATISIDGHSVGEKRVANDSLAPGTYKVSFRRDGWVPEERTLIVGPGRSNTVEVTLRQTGTP